MKNAYFIVCAVLLSGCATGKTISQSKDAVAPIPEGMGRVVVYRTGMLGAAIQPAVSIDGAKKGTCKPNGAFVADVTPGDRVVAATTEVTRETMVHVTSGNASYVRCSIGLGFFVGQPQLEVITPGRASWNLKNWYLQASIELSTAVCPPFLITTCVYQKAHPRFIDLHPCRITVRHGLQADTRSTWIDRSRTAHREVDL